MSITSTQFVILGVTAFLLAGFLTWPVRALAIKLSVMDLPNMERKTQKEPVPYLGGVAIALSIIIVTYGAILYSDNTKTTFPLVTYALLPAAVLGLMGLIDDIRGLPALPRLVSQTVVAILVAIFMLNSELNAVPFGNQLVNDIINVIWIVAICNSINFFDNLDGGAAGTVAVSTLGVFLIAFNQGQELISALAVVTCGATMGFLLWNKSPAKIYMGDAGALFLGVLLSVLTIRLNPGITPNWKSLAIPPILLAVPILDTCIAVFSRIKRGISPFQGGKDHLSHRLMRSGLSKRLAVISLWIMTAYFAAIAIAISNAPYQFEGLVSAIGAISWLAFFFWFLKKSDS